MRYNGILILFLFGTLNLGAQSQAVKYFEQGQMSLAREDFYAAGENFRTALKLNPSYREAREGLAETFYLLGEYDEALSHVLLADKLGKSAPQILVLWGRVLLGQGKLEEAKGKFLSVLQQDKKSIPAALGIAEYELMTGRYQKAAADWEEILRKDPRNLRASLSLILLYNHLKDPRKVDKVLQTALQYHSAEGKVHLFAAHYYKSQKQYSKALNEVNTYLTTANNEAGKGTMLKAEILLSLNNTKEIKTILEPYVKKNIPLASYLMGRSYQIDKNFDDALIFFQRAVDLEKDNEIYRLAMENLILKNLSVEDNARRQVPAQVHFDLAGEYKRKNYLTLSLDEIRRGLRIFPDSGTSKELQAQILKTQGFKVSSFEVLQSIQDIKSYRPYSYTDEWEIQKSSYEDTFGAQKWNLKINDFLTLRDAPEPPFYFRPYQIGIFYIPEDSRIPAFRGVDDLALFFATEVQAWRNMQIVTEASGNQNENPNPKIEATTSFDSAFKSARQGGKDFFIVLDFQEGNRDFLITAKLYLGRTGKEVGTFSVHKKGAWMMALACRELARNLSQFFPLKGTLIKRKDQGKTGLINLGSRDGVLKDQKFKIIRENSLRFSGEKGFFSFNLEDELGVFTVSATEDWIAEGTLEKKGTFDTMSVRDEVFFMKEPPSALMTPGVPLAYELQKEILNLR